jgi:hypothetical protein
MAVFTTNGHRVPNDNVDRDVQQETFQETVDLIAVIADSDIVLRFGWESLVAWSLLDPGRPPINEIIDDWDTLTPNQQQQIQALYHIPSWGDLSHWQQEAYRKGFERQIGYILRTAQAGVAEAQQQLDRDNENTEK